MSRQTLLRAFRWALVASVAMLCCLPAGAAETAQRVVRVGFIDPYSSSTGFRGVDGFWDRLRELGWVEGQNLTIEVRRANGKIDRIPALMAELTTLKVDVIVTYGTRGAIAAKNATSTIPIVAATMGDPIGSRLADSLSHPGGNLTGLSLGWTEGIAGKRLELLREAVPNLSVVALIADSGNPVAGEMAKELMAIAPTRNMKAFLIEVHQPQDLDRAFRHVRREAQAVLVLGDYFTFERRQQIAALAARYQVPVMYPAREYAVSGGLRFPSNFAFQR